MSQIVNVYVTERDGQEHFLVEREPREVAIEALHEMCLSDTGVVPSWVKSVEFYYDGDQVAEEYKSGDHIE